MLVLIEAYLVQFLLGNVLSIGCLLNYTSLVADPGIIYHTFSFLITSFIEPRGVGILFNNLVKLFSRKLYYNHRLQTNINPLFRSQFFKQVVPASFIFVHL